MNTYQIEVCETLCRVMSVRAKSAADAINDITDQYRESKIVLDATDFQDYTILAQ